jgi:hypothetical protein
MPSDLARESDVEHAATATVFDAANTSPRFCYELFPRAADGGIGLLTS